MEQKKKSIINSLSNIQLKLGLTILFISTIFMVLPSLPQIWYRVFPQATAQELESITKSRVNAETVQGIVEQKEENTLPKFDPNLTSTNTIIIPSIGVHTTVDNSPNYEEILKKGVWMVDNFPTPDSSMGPIIVASHRFGYIDWSAKQRREISFYNLPKLKSGDMVEIIWEQRLYKYEIVTTSEGSLIEDYGYDLILYTCKLYNSPERIFKYAKRVE